MRLLQSLTYSQLLRSPLFHKGVRRVHRKIEEVRRGEKLYDPEDFSGLHIDSMPTIHTEEWELKLIRGQSPRLLN